MEILRFGDTAITFDPARGLVTALNSAGTELLAAESPLFQFRLRHADGSGRGYVFKEIAALI